MKYLFVFTNGNICLRQGNKLLTLACLLIISFSNLLICESFDTLSYYNNNSPYISYNSKKNPVQGSRFDISYPCYIKQIQMTLTGRADTSAAFLHVYGHEGGLPVPKMSQDLLMPIKINKTKSGPEVITIDIEDDILIRKSQFFVSIEILNPEIKLVSDKKEKIPVCSSKEGGVYYFQFLRDHRGYWHTGKYGFAIDVIVEWADLKNHEIFKDITGDCGINDTLHYNQSISISDFNQDKQLDILVDGTLYENVGGAIFEDVTLDMGLHGSPMANFFIDINCDGYKDIIYIMDKVDSTNYIFMNTGDGSFQKSDLNIPFIDNPTGFSIGDINGDSYPDLFISQSEDSEANPLKNYLLINDLSNGFYDLSGLIYGVADKPKVSFGVSWTDFDNDGDLDLHVINSVSTDELWVNFGDLKFENMFTEKFIPSEQSEELDFTQNYEKFSAIWRDVNYDNIPDLISPKNYVIESGLNRTLNSPTMIENSGPPSYQLHENNTETGILFEEDHIGSCWADFNNDGNTDCFITVMCECRYSDLYFQNDNESFSNVNYRSGFNRRSLGFEAIAADFNNDGLQDLITMESGFLRIFQNKGAESNGHNYLAIDFEESPRKNAINTRTEIYASGKKYEQRLSSGRGLLIQEPLRLHLGLGVENNIDSILIFWPDSPLEPEKISNIELNKLLSIEDLVQSTDIKQTIIISHEAFPNPFTQSTLIRFELKEPEFVELSIYSMECKKIITLSQSYYREGKHIVNWDGRNPDKLRVPSGAYFYRIKAYKEEYLGKLIIGN